MIPFNHLGWLFSRFGTAAYPEAVVGALCTALRGVPDGGSVLDLGAGTGVVGSFAHGCRSDIRYVAADPSAGMLRYVPKYAAHVNARAEKLPFGENTFDAVLMGEALHHIADPESAFREIVRVLRGGGLLFIYEFDPSTLMGGFIHKTEKLLGEPGNFYPPETLAALLASHGFSVAAERYGWRYTLRAHLQESPTRTRTELA